VLDVFLVVTAVVTVTRWRDRRHSGQVTIWARDSDSSNDVLNESLVNHVSKSWL